MHQKLPHQKKVVAAHYRSNQYFSSPAPIVHAGHERANEAKLQRQSAHQSRLSTKGQNDPSDLLDQSHSAHDAMPLKWTTRDPPLHDSSWVGISVWASTDVVSSDLVCQSLHASYAVCCQRTLNCTLCGKRVFHINDTWWIDTKLRTWKFQSRFSQPQMDIWILRYTHSFSSLYVYNLKTFSPVC